MRDLYNYVYKDYKRNSPNDEENNDGHKQIIGLIVQKIIDHPVAPFLQVLEIR